MIIGIIAIVLSVIFFFFIKTNPSFFKGAAIPLLALGIIQCVVGFTVYSRSDKQRMDVSYKAGIEPVRFAKMEELPRMKKVMDNFVLFRWLEIFFAVAGIVLIFLFRTNAERVFWYGLGLTLAIQAILMLSADFVAEKRGKQYVAKLQQLIYPN